MKTMIQPATITPLILPAALATLCLVAANPAHEQAAPPLMPGIKVDDTLRHAPPGTVRIGGWIGGEIDRTIRNRVMAQDTALILKPYQERFEENAGHWRCEYWGKWFLSAALAQSASPTPDQAEILEQGVAGLLATQTPDGYIGTYKDEKHLGIWDVWGRKYTMLGLIADYDLTGNKESLEAACRVAEHLISQAPPGEFNLTENGIDVLQGLSSSSVVQPLAQLHQRTGKKAYLELANDIISNWSRGNRLIEEGLQLIEHAERGTPPALIASRKAYEMMSCFEGLCEMHRITGDPRLLNAAIRFAHAIRNSERMIHGSGSNQELWCDGVKHQTETLEQPVETCVTSTWMGLCDQLLRLTGDPLWADELELSLYNALLGAVTPDGKWWAYFSPLAGQRVPSHYQHADVEMSCCVANGPRGLLLTPRWAVMAASDGVAVNLYAPGEATLKLADGTGLRIVQQTDYPATDAIRITVSPEKPSHFALKLRIPHWSTQSTLEVNGVAVAVGAGRYAVIGREWRAGDRVDLRLDLRGRAVPAPSGAPALAVMRGPLVLALDDRLAPPQDIAVRLVTDDDGHVALRPLDPVPPGVRMAFEVSFKVQPKHYFDHYVTTLVMCDYASAGNGWSGENLFRVWLPQPLFLRHAYPAETWRLTCPGADACPDVPARTSVKQAPAPAAPAAERQDF